MAKKQAGSSLGEMGQHQKQIKGSDGQLVIYHRLVIYEKVCIPRDRFIPPGLIKVVQVCHSAYVDSVGRFLQALHCLPLSTHLHSADLSHRHQCLRHGTGWLASLFPDRDTLPMYSRFHTLDSVGVQLRGSLRTDSALLLCSFDDRYYHRHFYPRSSVARDLEAAATHETEAGCRWNVPHGDPVSLSYRPFIFSLLIRLAALLVRPSLDLSSSLNLVHNL